MNAKLLLGGVALLLGGCVYYPHPDMRHGLHHGAGPLRAAGESTLTGFTFPESVGCDHAENVLYVSQFGGTELKPLEKDGKGFISKLAADGTVLEQRAFNEAFNKPKGIWIRGDRLWVTDIDSVWVFDTKSKRGRKLPIPGIQFANDPAVVGNVLYVSDNRSDSLFRIEPADFLEAGVQPNITTAWTKKEINPNGIWPTRDGSLIVVGWTDKPRGIHFMGRDGNLKTVVQPFGRLDGVYQAHDGSLLVTDWNAGTLNHWSEQGGLVPLAKGFKGPADFCVMRDTVYVPDLVSSEIRVVRLTR
jgi:hypothetical protein